MNFSNFVLIAKPVWKLLVNKGIMHEENLMSINLEKLNGYLLNKLTKHIGKLNINLMVLAYEQSLTNSKILKKKKSPVLCQIFYWLNFPKHQTLPLLNFWSRCCFFFSSFSSFNKKLIVYLLNHFFLFKYNAPIYD